MNQINADLGIPIPQKRAMLYTPPATPPTAAARLSSGGA
jgi:hypothetical protein